MKMDMTPMTVESNPNLKLHHTASYRGYVSRKSDGEVYEYDGKFGKGFCIYKPRWDSSTYCYVEYWVETDEAKEQREAKELADLMAKLDKLIEKYDTLKGKAHAQIDDGIESKQKYFKLHDIIREMRDTEVVIQDVRKAIFKLTKV